MSRPLNEVDKEIEAKIKELQLFVVERQNTVSDIDMGQRLITDIQIIRHIWTKNKDSL